MATSEPANETEEDDSEHTSYDSDQVDAYAEDDEYSRVLPTPQADPSEQQAGLTHSTPRAQRNAPWIRASQPVAPPSQHTQQLQPLSGTQLRAMLADGQDDDSVEAATEGEDGTQTFEQDYNETERRKSIASPDETRMAGIGDETDRRAVFEEAINTDSIAPEYLGPDGRTVDAEDERILSSNDEANGTEEAPLADVTPTDFRLDLNTFGARAKGQNRDDFIDETPMKLLSMPTPPSLYVYVIVKWASDPYWWPARAEKVDWELRKPKALVTFRLDQTGIVDLGEAAGQFALGVGDKVHVHGSSRRKYLYTVISLWVDPLADSRTITTIEGYNKVKLEYKSGSRTTKSRTKSNIKTVDVDVADIYFTNANMEAWRSNHEAVAAHSRPSTPRKDSGWLNDDTYDGERVDAEGDKTASTTAELVAGASVTGTVAVSTSSPRKRRQADTSPVPRSNRAKVTKDADNVSTALQRSPRTPRAARRTSSYRALLTESPTKVFSTRSSPSSKLNSAKASVASDLFQNSIFTITLSSGKANTQLNTKLPELVRKHGGEVLESGLSENVKLSDVDDEDGAMPIIEFHFGGATFAAVLSDAPRRTPKYLEMLALGWPCLHYQYLFDCVDQQAILDWKSYLLPAGELNLKERRMMVSCDASAFHARWLQNASLDEQFRKRRIVLKASVPLCVLSSGISDNETRKRLLVAMSAPLYRIWFYTDPQAIPDGSLILDLDEMDSSSPSTHPEVLYQLKNFAATNDNVYKNLEWFVQCLINGDIV